MRTAILLTCLWVCACHGTRGEVASTEAPRLVHDLPTDWSAVPPSTFEERIVDLDEAEVRWSEEARGQLAVALDAGDPTSVRAAVLLAYDSSPAVTGILLDRLEKRVKAESRSLDAGDLVAAAALDGRGELDRVVELAVGADPHPDLEVRVECARTALRRGREEVVPFLLTVLRALTPAERQHPADWERVKTMMWAKSRAGEALADRLGVERRVRPDGSWADQMAEADRLEALFARERR